jgi:hypothetical protein
MGWPFLQQRICISLAVDPFLFRSIYSEILYNSVLKEIGLVLLERGIKAGRRKPQSMGS